MQPQLQHWMQLLLPMASEEPYPVNVAAVEYVAPYTLVCARE